MTAIRGMVVSAAVYRSFDLAVALHPAPIQADWIRAGTPTASNAIVARSSDGAAYTMVWECTAGAFEWIYDCDETVHILDGSILLTDTGNPARRLVPGDAVFFPKGARVYWQVEGHVRKLAFMHDIPPAPVTIGMKAYRRLKNARPAQTAARIARALRGSRAAVTAKLPA